MICNEHQFCIGNVPESPKMPSKSNIVFYGTFNADKTANSIVFTEKGIVNRSSQSSQFSREGRREEDQQPMLIMTSDEVNSKPDVSYSLANLSGLNNHFS